MTERIDHAALAKESIYRSGEVQLVHAGLALAEGQVHATLALVEQQSGIAEQLRVQNLIAYLAQLENGPRQARLSPDDQGMQRLEASIREGLGL